jgi:hypothetical protein
MWSKMIEVFKTNIDSVVVAAQVVQEIMASIDDVEANFDLEDCDKVLRVCCGKDIAHLTDVVLSIVTAKGYLAVVMDDETVAIVARASVFNE